MKTQFSHNLKSKRLEYGWSQERVAQEISERSGKHLSEQAYQHWEKGRRSPTIEMLITIVEVFQIDDLYLFIRKSD